MTDVCLFCQIVNGQIPSDQIYEDREILAFKDIHPAAPTHILVIPKRHISTVSELTARDVALVGKIVYRATRIAKDLELCKEGYRLVWNNGVGAGQSVFHIHLHLLGGRRFSWPPG